MNYKLVSCLIVGDIDRIRGAEEIPIRVDCKFKVFGYDDLVEISGMATCTDPKWINETYEDAVKDAEAKLNKMIGGSVAPSKLAELIRETINPKVRATVKSETTENIAKLYEMTDEFKQKEVNILCEALGIPTIPILQQEWSMIEALVLINYLKDLTNPMAK